MSHLRLNRCMRVIVVLVSVFLNQAFAAELKDFFKRSDQRAVELLEQGRHDQATALFEDRQWRGVSQFRAGKYEEAMQDFDGAEDARSLFNHGTAAARAGDYTQAVTSLETAVGLDPDNQEFKHNLDIAQKLKELAEKNQSEQEQNDGDESQDQKDQEKKEKSDSEEQAEGDESEQSQEQSGEQASDEQQGQGEESGDEQQQSNGELSADADQPPAEKPPELDDFNTPENEQQDDQQQGEPKESESNETAVADTTVSEDDQATQQWLRRIPDDASQLLRNKIRLNHMIEYPEVNHMQEPW